MHVRMTGIGKRFGHTPALTAVDFEARPGEVTALLGENGAGKSTLMKVLYGMYPPDTGTVELDGRRCTANSPRGAIALGIAMVFQHFSLIPALSVRENLALVARRSRWWTGRDARAVEHLEDPLRRWLPRLDLSTRVAELSAGEMQMIELAKALLLDARCLILDEPSSVLAPREAAHLWALLRELTGSGRSVILITHKLADVRACADRISVLRTGRLVASFDAGDQDDAAIVAQMVGTDLPPPRSRPVPAVTMPARWSVRRLCAGSVRDIEFDLRPGEILGVAGVAGNGQAALADALAGLLPLDAGEVLLDGRRLHWGGRRPTPVPEVGYIPERPLDNAVVADQPLAVNLALRRLRSLPLLPDRRRLRADATAQIARFDVRPSDPGFETGRLSGGNLQRLVIAREVAGRPAVLIACHPTMGLDIGATHRIYEALFGLADEGCAILWFSESLDDLIAYAHRIAVMSAGRIMCIRSADSTNVTELGSAMAGSAPALVDQRGLTA